MFTKKSAMLVAIGTGINFVACLLIQTGIVNNQKGSDNLLVSVNQYRNLAQIHVVDLAKDHVKALKKIEENAGLKIYNLGNWCGLQCSGRIVKNFEAASPA